MLQASICDTYWMQHFVGFLGMPNWEETQNTEQRTLLLGEVSNTVYLFIIVPVGEWYIREQVNFLSSRLMC